MSSHSHKDLLFPIIDAMVSEAESDCAEDGNPISCKKGCTHCCYLLVETSWEEAEQLAEWVNQLPERRRSVFVSRIRAAASEARSIFGRRKKTELFQKPVSGEHEIPEKVYDEYFYEKPRACPFLEFGSCSAYSVRPSPCRLHLVSSDPNLCSASVEDDSAYEIPERIEQLKKEIEPVMHALEKEELWGQLAIMVESVLEASSKQESESLSSKKGESQDLIDQAQVA